MALQPEEEPGSANLEGQHETELEEAGDRGRAEAGSFSDGGYQGHIPSSRSWTLLLPRTEEF